MEECLKNVRKDPNVNITEVIDVANVKAQLIETQKKYTSIKERLEIELVREFYYFFPNVVLI